MVGLPEMFNFFKVAKTRYYGLAELDKKLEQFLEHFPN